MSTARDSSEQVVIRDGVRIEDGARARVDDPLTVEAPLHVRINGEAYTTTMRTPGADEFLIRGLLFTEAIVTRPGAAMRFEPVDDPETGFAGSINVGVDTSLIDREFAARRSQMSASSCGLCGTREPRDIEIFGPPIAMHRCGPIPADAIRGMMARMREEQSAFETTGGCHAAGLYSEGCELLALHEDIGRHNAVDKAIGELVARDALRDAAVLTVSGRMSYEIVFKAYRAGIPVLCAVSAPSSMAVDTCAQFGMTLLGYCRGERMTVYTHAERIV